MINKIKIFKINALAIFGVFAMLVFSSCEKFLDEKPSKTTSLVVTTTDQLSALLNNYSTFYQEENRSAIYSTDDNGLNVDLYNARPATFTLTYVEFTLWDKDFLPGDTRDRLWSGEYRKIFNANMVLANVDKVSGSEADKAALRADAHFIRAYSYYLLANTYCLPYTEANKNAQGLPIKKTVGFDEPVARAPLHVVYELIESDLQEALKTTVPLVQGGVAHNWRASVAAVNGFAARYYLNSNNYSEALKYANTTLDTYSRLINYNTEMRYGIPATITIDAGTPDQKSVILQFPYTHDMSQFDVTDMIGWKEFLYFRMLSAESWWYIPSQSLLNLYDTANDLRYKYHVVENYSYNQGITKPSYSYPGYSFFFKDKLPSGPTTAEMYLIKAECLARSGDVSGAMTAVNMLHSKRVLSGSPLLSAESKEGAIKEVLKERRREMPYTARWFDIRRFNNNDDPSDDVILTKVFYPYNGSSILMNESPIEYSLPKDSKRFAAPIPMTEIISSNGAIEQNKY